MKTSFATIAFTLTASAVGVFQPTVAQAGGRGIIGHVAHCIASHAGGGHRGGGPMHSSGPVYSHGPSYPAPVHHAPAPVHHAQSPVYQNGPIYQNSPIYQNNSAPMYEPYVEGPSYSQPVYSNPQQSSFPSQPGMSMPSSGNVVQANGSAPQYSQSMPVAQASSSMNSEMPASGMQQNYGQSVMNQSNQALAGQSANVQSMRPAMSGNAAVGQQASRQPGNGSSQEQNAAQSALQMLASLGGQSEVGNQPAASESSEADFALPQFTAAPAASQPVQAGAWQVSLPGNQTIQLVLNDDSSFVWTASKDGKSSSFEGRYVLENGRLTLVRANDQQQMSGSWSQTDRRASFKLDGTNSSALEFSRLAS